MLTCFVWLLLTVVFRGECVQVIVGEGLLAHGSRGFRGGAPLHHVGFHAVEHLAHAIELAGNQLERGVPERRAAAVGERDPAVDVGELVVARDGQDVVGVPRQLRGEVRRLHTVVRRPALVVQRPDQRGPREQVARQFRKADVIGVEAGHDLAADLPDRRVVVAEKPGGDGFFPHGAAVLPQPYQRDVTPDVLAEQLLRLEQVVFVVLFEDVEPRRLGQRAEVHGRRVDGGGNIHEPQIRHAARQPQRADVAHQGEIRVVDGECQLGLIVERRRILRRRCRRGDERTCINEVGRPARRSARAREPRPRTVRTFERSSCP